MKLKISYWPIFIIFYALFIPFGAHFLKIGGKLNALFIFMGFSIVYFAFIFNKIKISLTDFKKYTFLAKTFYIFLFVVLILSCLNFYKNVFPLNDLDYNKSFIIRQGYFLFIVPIGLLLFKQVISSNVIEKMRFAPIALYLFALVFLRVACPSLVDLITFSEGFFILASFVFFKFNRPLGMLLFLAIFPLTADMSSYKLGYIIVLAIMMLDLCGLSKLKLEYKNVKIACLLGAITVVALLPSIFERTLDHMLLNDPNALWRWQYWLNELVTLIKTNFIGVGYGTAYASNSIWYEIVNTSCFQTSSDAFAIPQELVLFVTTQHSSFINMFYRAGLLGGVIMFIVNIYPVMFSVKAMCSTIGRERKLLLWALTNFIAAIFIIALNPGLESPRFMFSYVVMYAVNLGLAYKALRKAKQKKMILKVNKISDKEQNLINTGEII